MGRRSAHAQRSVPRYTTAPRMSGEFPPRIREGIPAKRGNKWADLRRPLCGRSAPRQARAPGVARAPHGVLRMSGDVPAGKAGDVPLAKDNAVEANRKQWGIGAGVRWGE